MDIPAIRYRFTLKTKQLAARFIERENDSNLEKLSESTSQVLDRNTEIRAELQQILASEFFRNSKRSQAFLHYVVEATCMETTDELKERTLGIAIFGRAPDYDTGTDAIVRVKASEVRRRLSQYNFNATSDRPIIIELHPGSYIPHICRKPALKLIPSVAPIEQSKSIKSKLFISMAFMVLIFIFCSFIYTARSSPASPLVKFWEPYLHQAQPIICTAFPSVYTRIPNTIKDVSDTHAAFLIKNQLQDLGRSSRVAVADDIDFSDLKRSPIVLIGGPRVNRWTLSMTKDLRFAFEIAGNKRRIVDRQNATRFWEDQAVSAAGEPLEDYMVVTRLIHSPAGQAMVSVAGITASGSQAAGELIANASSLQNVLKYAPEGWEHKNLQLVLRTRIIEGRPGPPELTASTYW